MSKPPFNPNQPFQAAEKPPFDPSQPFEEEQAPASLGGFIDTVKNTWNQLKESPIVTQSPIGALSKIPDIANQAFGKMGEDLATELSRPKIKQNVFTGKMFRDTSMDPRIAAGIGTVTSMLPTAAMLAATPIEAPGMLVESAPPSLMQKIGAAGVNNSVGITPRTLANMAGKGNPAELGTKLGTSLVNENAVGLTPGGTFNKAHGVMKQFGEKVGTSLDQIKASGVPTTVRAEEALEPLVAKWTSLKDSALSGTRSLAKPFEEVYGKLAQKANGNGGQVDLDHVREALDEVGDLLHNVSHDSPKYAAYADLYGTLAKMRSSIVQKIANAAKNPQLKQNLLEANEGYSRYSQIMPDIRKGAAREGVSQFPIFSPIKGAVKAIQPLFSKAAVKLGQRSAAPTLPAYEGAIAAEGAPLNESPKHIIEFPPKKPKLMFKKAG